MNLKDFMCPCWSPSGWNDLALVGAPCQKLSGGVLFVSFLPLKSAPQRGRLLDETSIEMVSVM